MAPALFGWFERSSKLARFSRKTIEVERERECALWLQVTIILRCRFPLCRDLERREISACLYERSSTAHKGQEWGDWAFSLSPPVCWCSAIFRNFASHFPSEYGFHELDKLPLTWILSAISLYDGICYQMIKLIKLVYATLFRIRFSLIFSSFLPRYSDFLSSLSCFVREASERAAKQLLILEEFEWNWGKFQWNLRLFYIHRKRFRSHGFFFRKYNSAEFFSRQSSCVDDRNPHNERTDFLLLYLKKFFFFFLFLCVFFLFFISHTARPSPTHRSSSRLRLAFEVFRWKRTFGWGDFPFSA